MNKFLLELRHISVSFEGFLALNDLNLSLQAGELRAVIGPNGAGKTTFLDVITGKVKPTKGEVIFKGYSLGGKREHHIARLGVGRKFQSPRVFENLSVFENLALAVSTPKKPIPMLLGKIKSKERDEIHHLMNIVNLQLKANIQAGELSHGQKQWLEIAMLVGQDPDLLLVDEPVAGLTDEETDMTADLLKSLSGDHTILVIDHDMEFIRRLNSPISVLHQGTVICEGPMEKIQQDQRVVDVYLGRTEEITQ